MSILDTWSGFDIITVLLERKLIQFSNPRPCKRCQVKTIFGHANKRYCPKCKEILHNLHVRRMKHEGRTGRAARRKVA